MPRYIVQETWRRASNDVPLGRYHMVPRRQERRSYIIEADYVYTGTNSVTFERGTPAGSFPVLILRIDDVECIQEYDTELEELEIEGYDPELQDFDTGFLPE